MVLYILRFKKKIMTTTSGHSKSQRESLMMLTTDILFACFIYFFKLFSHKEVSKKQKRKSAPLLILKLFNRRRHHNMRLTSMRCIFHQGALVPRKRLLKRLRKVKQRPANDDIVVKSHKVADLQKSKRIHFYRSSSNTPFKTVGWNSLHNI